MDGALRIEEILKALLTDREVTKLEQECFAPVVSGAVLTKALFNLDAAIEASGAVVTSDPLPVMVGEAVKRMQLFQNLITHSLKYRGVETPGIDISPEKDAEGRRFAVRDNGIGIGPRDAGRVFGMFKSLHGGEIPGTGIGLALCKKIVERQGGRISVESEVGRGAAFQLTVPGLHKLVRPRRVD